MQGKWAEKQLSWLYLIGGHSGENKGWSELPVSRLCPFKALSVLKNGSDTSRPDLKENMEGAWWVCGVLMQLWMPWLYFPILSSPPLLMIWSLMIWKGNTQVYKPPEGVHCNYPTLTPRGNWGTGYIRGHDPKSQQTLKRSQRGTSTCRSSKPCQPDTLL